METKPPGRPGDTNDPTRRLKPLQHVPRRPQVPGCGPAIRRIGATHPRDGCRSFGGPFARVLAPRGRGRVPRSPNSASMRPPEGFEVEDDDREVLGRIPRWCWTTRSNGPGKGPGSGDTAGGRGKRPSKAGARPVFCSVISVWIPVKRSGCPPHSHRRGHVRSTIVGIPSLWRTRNSTLSRGVRHLQMGRDMGNAPCRGRPGR
jgi:hypothetical protein